MTICKSFEVDVEQQLYMVRDQSSQYAQKHEDNNVKQLVVAGSKGSEILYSQTADRQTSICVEGQQIPFGLGICQELVPLRSDAASIFLPCYGQSY